MVANLAKPTPERPALMTHDGMETSLSIPDPVLILHPISEILCRRCHVLPRVWTCRTWAIEQGATFEVPWNEVRAPMVPFVSLGAFVLIARGFVDSVARICRHCCEGFRRGSLSDVGKLGLETQSAEEDFEPL